MSELKKYFDTDFKYLLSSSHNRLWEITRHGNIEAKFTIIEKLHFDFTSNSIFISYYIPDITKHILNKGFLYNLILRIDGTLSMNKGCKCFNYYDFEKILPPINIKTFTLAFTNLIYIYSENKFTIETLNYLGHLAEKKNIRVIIRDSDYVKERIKIDIPKAFICHDNRDKNEVARPIAEKLIQLRHTVWYDEYSLRHGDSIRERVEDGLKKCKKCVLILSPNFLANKGWTKKEFNSIFTREVLEKENLTIPIWHNVSQKEIFQYCPSLADIYAIKTSEGIDEVVKKLIHVLD